MIPWRTQLTRRYAKNYTLPFGLAWLNKPWMQYVPFLPAFNNKRTKVDDVAKMTVTSSRRTQIAPLEVLSSEEDYPN